jgi:hypothetical protein
MSNIREEVIVKQAEEIKELIAQNKAYKRAWELAKGFKDKAENSAATNQWAKDSLESEKEMNQILTNEIATLEENIVAQDKVIIQQRDEASRLKGIIKSLIVGIKKMDIWNELSEEEYWEEFKKENNL